MDDKTGEKNKEENKKEPEKYNESEIRLAWFPRSAQFYTKKGLSNINPGNPQHGKFAAFVKPDKFYSPNEYIKQSILGVDDFLAAISAGCTDAFCLKGNVKQKPYKEYSIITKGFILPEKK
jgi:hypothetical protein